MIQLPPSVNKTKTLNSSQFCQDIVQIFLSHYRTKNKHCWSLSEETICLCKVAWWEISSLNSYKVTPRAQCCPLTANKEASSKQRPMQASRSDNCVHKAFDLQSNTGLNIYSWRLIISLCDSTLYFCFKGREKKTNPKLTQDTRQQNLNHAATILPFIHL